MRVLLIAGVLCIALSLAAIITFIWLHVANAGDIPFHHGIVIDAGSSHSEALLYKWSADKLNDTGIVKQQAHCKTHIGIDDNGANTNITVNNLMPCIAKVTKAIDSDDEMDKVTPVYLGATAGMRILNATKPEISQLIFVSLENAMLRFKSGKNRLHVKTFRIIAGREEALYAWISANYISGLIPNLGRKNADMLNISSIGVMDMGGASAQISYQVKEEHLEQFDKSDLQTVRLYGHDFYVRGESNLCMGANEVIHRHRTLQIIANRGATKIEDPCYNSGTLVKVPGKELETICTVPASDSDNFMKSDQTYEFSGKYDEQKCLQLLEDAFDPLKCKSKFAHCFIAEKQPPPSDTIIYGISNYVHTADAINVTQTTLDEYTTKAKQYCAMSYGDVLKVGFNPKFAADNCLKLNAVYTIFNKLYKFEDKQWSNVRFAKKINGQSLGWALGFMTHETNLIPAEAQSDGLITTAVLVAALVTALIILTIGVFLLIKWKRNGESVNVPASGKETHALKDYNRNDV